ncbi:DUF2064 domain-containing protein [Streptomyces sp. HNM0575]|nr:DUF2064 domain-containing protein [Streptomyces sp. HNM0575]
MAAAAVRLPAPVALPDGASAPAPAPAPASVPATATAPDPDPAPLTVLVIAKEPVPGRVKTRLTPPYRPEEAARLAEAALADTLETVARLNVRRRVLVLAGRPGPWLPSGFEVVPQCEGGLDRRIAAAFALCDGPALLIGMDTPQITAALLSGAEGTAPTGSALKGSAPRGGGSAGRSAADGPWEDCDAWFGPAEDGGFWALGMACPRPQLVLGVPMSRPDTGAVQRQRLVEAGLSVRDLPLLRDVDTAADAAHVASLSSRRFAAVHAELARTAAT